MVVQVDKRTPRHIEVAELLIDLEASMRNLSLWSDTPPSAEALRSTQPFGVDTMTLPEWLQFIFLPRMHDLVARGAALPERCGIVPMAEEYFRGGKQPVELIEVLEAVDRALCVNEPRYDP